MSLLIKIRTSLSLNLVIKPEPCLADSSNAATCVADTDSVTIFNKIGGEIEFPVLRSLKIERIIIDSIDSIIHLSEDSSNCLSTKE